MRSTDPCTSHLSTFQHEPREPARLDVFQILQRALRRASDELLAELGPHANAAIQRAMPRALTEISTELSCMSAQLRAEHETTLAQLRAEHAQDLARLRAEHETTLARLRAPIS